MSAGIGSKVLSTSLSDWDAQETEIETDPKVSNYLLYYLLYRVSRWCLKKKVLLCSKKKARKKKERHGAGRQGDCVRQQGISGEHLT